MMSSRDTISRRWRRAVLVWSSIASMMALSACGFSSSRPPVEVDLKRLEVELPPARPALPDPQPADLQQVRFVVLTPEVAASLGSDWVFIALTPDQYEIMSRNSAELLRWATEAAWRLRYYRGEQ